MFDIDLHQLILSFKYVGLFILLISNGIISFPSSQIIYLIIGYFVSVGKISLVPSIIIGATGNTIGNLIIYKIVSKYGVDAVRKYSYINDRSLNHLHKKVEAKGLWFLFIGKLIPSVKVFVPIVAGLARIKILEAIIIFFSSSAIWAGAIISIGYFFGENITMQGYAIVMGIIGIIVAIVFYFRFIKNKKMISSN